MRALTACGALMLTACGPALMTAAPPHNASLSASAEDAGRSVEQQARRCQRLSDWQWATETTAGSLAIVAGGEGLGAIPVDDPETVRALAVAGGITAGTSAAVMYLSGQLSDKYLEECSE